MKDIKDYFYEIASIPRGSKNEKAISDYIVAFAKKHNFEYIQDQYYNVVVYVPASLGYEDHPTVMLQGHMDIVCEKEKDSPFDFETQGLELYEEDGFLHAKSTTLGADDGYAISYMLGIMDSDTPHPPLECTFTVQEEIGLVGARKLKKKYFKATRLISMDSGGEEVVSVSCSGGRRNKATKKMSLISKSGHTFEFTIHGLLGGHSGGNINKERGNANKIAFRIMKEIQKELPVYLVSVNGGAKENAIPRECKIVFQCDTSIKLIDAIILDMMAELKITYASSDANLKYTLRQVDEASLVCDQKSSEELINYMVLVPNGVRHISMEIKDLVIASNNVGVIHLEGDECIITTSIRSPQESLRDEIANEIELLGETFGFEVANFNDYPGWNYEANSELRGIYKQVLLDTLQKELKERASHGGLEAGVIKGLLPAIDIITLGPYAYNAHTPEEKMDIASFYRMYDVLKEVLKRL